MCQSFQYFPRTYCGSHTTTFVFVSVVYKANYLIVTSLELFVCPPPHKTPQSAESHQIPLNTAYQQPGFRGFKLLSRQEWLLPQQPLPNEQHQDRGELKYGSDKGLYWETMLLAAFCVLGRLLLLVMLEILAGRYKGILQCVSFRVCMY